MACSTACLISIVKDASYLTNPFYDQGQNQNVTGFPYALKAKHRALLDPTGTIKLISRSKGVPQVPEALSPVNFEDLSFTCKPGFAGKNHPMKNGFTQGEMESAIRNAIIKFEQEFMGRGPTDVRAFILRDTILIRLKGVLTPAERQLAKSEEGIGMVKQMRQNLISQGREQLCRQILEITGAETTALFTDIDARIEERIIVMTLDRDLESTLR